MKWVWGSLVLMAVVLGSAIIWWRFETKNVGAPFMAPIVNQKGAMNRAPTTGILFRNDEGSVLAVFGKAPDFSLTERSGKTFSKANVEGKPWIADFIFTSCAGQCPLMNQQMKKFQDQFGPESGFRFVSFTVDPDRDTPEVLSEYAKRYNAKEDQWFFLTGPKEETNRILKEFFLSPVDQPAMHSVRFILVDAEGQIRGYYDSSDPGSMNQLVHDARILLGT